MRSKDSVSQNCVWLHIVETQLQWLNDIGVYFSRHKKSGTRLVELLEKVSLWLPGAPAFGYSFHLHE